VPFLFGKMTSHDILSGSGKTGSDQPGGHSLKELKTMPTQASLDLAQELYVAYYGRPADPAGQTFWADAFDGAGDDLTDALAAFGESTEYTDGFSSLTSTGLVQNLYQQLFSRAGDTEGVAFYVDRLDTGAATLASIAKQIADGAQGTDITALNNKITVANTYTTTISSTGETYDSGDIAAAQAILLAVDETEVSVTAGNAAAIQEASNNSNPRYQVIEEAATFAEATAHAESLGGHLVIIDDPDENNIVYDLLLNANIVTTAPDGGGAVYAWIGATDEINEDVWLWADGTPVDFANWGSAGIEPDNFIHPVYAPSGQDYAAMALSSWPYGSAGEWNDISEQNELAYVVEFSASDIL
jgi:hypothetical protein